MEAQEDKNKQNVSPDETKSLEEEMKSAYKDKNFDAVRASYDKLIKLDPENRLAVKLMEKVEKAQAKADKKAKKAKAKEYISMLKQLYKEEDVQKLTELAKEFKESDPENKHAIKWEMRAAKLKEKLTGEVEEKPVEEKPKEEAKPKEEPVKIEAKAEESKIAAPPVKPIVSKPAEVNVPKGNLFTKMFDKKEDEIQKKSIIDTIVAKTDKEDAEVKKPEAAPKKTMQPEVEGVKPPEEGKEAAGLLTLSKVFLNFAIIFIVFSAAFLYVEWIDKDNTVLALAGISENTGGRLHNASLTLEDKEEEERELNKDIDLYKEGYEDQAIVTVGKIIDERINWPDIFTKIKEVTNSVYELNDFFKYIEYFNYSFDAARGSVSVSGSLSDPLGRNLTKLVELEEAFMNYPRDKNDPEDTTEPYFSGFKEFTSFSKTLDPETGRYNSSFQLSFTINK